MEDVDAAKGIIGYVKENAIDILVLGASKMTLLKYAYFFTLFFNYQHKK